MISADDVFQESEPVVVDCDLLEAAKENVQPLATGRRVTALSTVLATPAAQRDAKLSATRNRLRINVELALEDEDGDPLDAYCRLVYWTMENYPQGHSAESGLLELLEEATRVLKDHNGGVYRGDMKYLKLWLIYASYVERPTIIYRFLLANDIGIGFALLYEEHAAVLERDGRKQEADEIYALGIARKAEPLDHLESRYQDFQKRMISTFTAPAPEPARATQAAQPKRQALATTSKIPTSTSRTGGTRIASSSRNTTVAAPTNMPPPSNRGGFQIFVDPSGQNGEAGEGGENGWHDLGTRKTRVKENVPETKKLVGTTIKQAGKTRRVVSASAASGSGSGSSGSSGSKFAIFRDPVDAPTPTPPAPAAASSSRKPSSSGKATKAFVPFVDEADVKKPSPTPPETPRAATPKFTPFRDEGDAESSRATAVPVGDAVIKVKKTGPKAPVPTSEAEALRKDPLKNYSTNDT
ncbi:other/BUB protein kinase [Coprinopsis cinerea AmutBmut pab1-1]|nr:other/BUB protein kinase [Coprinopsis cinerea AmutBmut pab1-1]